MVIDNSQSSVRLSRITSVYMMSFITLIDLSFCSERNRKFAKKRLNERNTNIYYSITACV